MEFDFILASHPWLDALENAMKETVLGIQDADIFVADDRESLRRHLSDEGRILMAVDRALRLPAEKSETAENLVQPKLQIKTREGELAGFLLIRFPGAAEDNLGVYAGIAPDEMNRVAHMESVTVRPLYRGHGLQRRLVDRGETLARKMGYKYSMCTVAPQNQWSLANMQAAGYSIVATVPKYGGLMRHILLKRL